MSVSPALYSPPAFYGHPRPYGLTGGPYVGQPPAADRYATPSPLSLAPPAIQKALVLLGQIRHLPQDHAYMRSLGVDPVFQNGAEALRTLLMRGARAQYGDMGDSKAHAEWRADQNTVIINQKYRGDESPATLLAMSEALYHEAGHVARQGDGQASIQEEINCLALNTLAHRYHMATVPGYAQSVSSSRLITDGVALYEKLFFDADPEKRALVSRIIEKYGELPPETPDHRIPTLAYGVPLADRVLRTIQYRKATSFTPQTPQLATAPAYSRLA